MARGRKQTPERPASSVRCRQLITLDAGRAAERIISLSYLLTGGLPVKYRHWPALKSVLKMLLQVRT